MLDAVVLRAAPHDAALRTTSPPGSAESPTDAAGTLA